MSTGVVGSPPPPIKNKKKDPHSPKNLARKIFGGILIIFLGKNSKFVEKDKSLKIFDKN
jgi:hypothetical protein